MSGYVLFNLLSILTVGIRWNLIYRIKYLLIHNYVCMYVLFLHPNILVQVNTSPCVTWQCASLHFTWGTASHGLQNTSNSDPRHNTGTALLSLAPSIPPPLPHPSFAWLCIPNRPWRKWLGARLSASNCKCTIYTRWAVVVFSHLSTTLMYAKSTACAGRNHEVQQVGYCHWGCVLWHFGGECTILSTCNIAHLQWTSGCIDCQTIETADRRTSTQWGLEHKECEWQLQHTDG